MFCNKRGHLRTYSSAEKRLRGRLIKRSDAVPLGIGAGRMGVPRQLHIFAGTFCGGRSVNSFYPCRRQNVHQQVCYPFLRHDFLIGAGSSYFGSVGSFSGQTSASNNATAIPTDTSVKR